MSLSLNQVQSYTEKHRNRFISELKSLLRIPSISAQPVYKPDMHACATHVCELLKQAGMQKSKVMQTKGQPVVYAEFIQHASLPTVLVYGHYDVQPPEPLELWDSPPFEPVEKEGKLYARGSADDKGQFMMHIKALEMMLAHDYMPCNVKVLIEGEEEVGSSNLGIFINQHKQLLSCDTVLISDSAMHSLQQPTIDIGTRGLSYIEIEVTGPSHDLHSGVYGGAIPNPITILVKMLASLHDTDQKIAIPHFYDEVQSVRQSEKELLAKSPYNEEAYLKETGARKTWGEKGFSTVERVGIRPTLEINGIWGGYIKEGEKTVLPSKAYAKISCRLVPNQSSKKITNLLVNHLYAISPDYVKTNITVMQGGNPYVTPIDSLEYKAAEAAIKETFGINPIPTRGGGSIPIVATFEELLQVKTVFMGFGLNDDNLHSPNEKFTIENYLKGIVTIPFFYMHYAKLKQQSTSK